MNQIEGRTINDIVKDESLKLYAMIDNKQVFSWIRNLNNDYFGNVFDNDKLFNYSLDIYNYYLKNGIKHQTVFYANKRLMEVMFKEYYGGNK